MDKYATSWVFHPCARNVGQSAAPVPQTTTAATSTTTINSTATCTSASTTQRRVCNTSAQERNKRQPASPLLRKASDCMHRSLRHVISADPHNPVAEVYRAGQLCCGRSTIRRTRKSRNDSTTATTRGKHHTHATGRTLSAQRELDFVEVRIIFAPFLRGHTMCT